MAMLVWDPFHPTRKSIPMKIKDSGLFVTVDVFNPERIEESGYNISVDYVFAKMLSLQRHTFICIISTPAELEKVNEYYALRSNAFGMRDLGRMVWGNMLNPPEVAPESCFSWPPDNVTVYSRVK